MDKDTIALLVFGRGKTQVEMISLINSLRVSGFKVQMNKDGQSFEVKETGISPNLKNYFTRERKLDWNQAGVSVVL